MGGQAAATGPRRRGIEANVGVSMREVRSKRMGEAGRRGIVTRHISDTVTGVELN